MKIVSLNKKQLVYFKELDPFEFREKKDIDLTFKLGAVYEAEDDFEDEYWEEYEDEHEEDIEEDAQEEPEDGSEEGNLLAGLLLGTRKEDGFVILWLYVEPALRRKGMGEALLAEAFLEAEKAGLKQVAAVFPNDYGRELICKTEKEFFELHGFKEEKKGLMTAEVADFYKQTTYEGPSFLDEAFFLDEFLSEDPSETEDVHKNDYDDADYFVKTHKNWEIKKVNLKEFSQNPNLITVGKRILKGDAPVRAGGVCELTLSQYKQVLRLCEKNGHTGFPDDLFDIPADYFDLEVSSYAQEDTDRDDDYNDEKVSGVCLIHYNRTEHALYAELLYAVGKEYVRSLGELVRCSIIAAVKKYPADTTVVLPYDREFHRPLMEKLFADS